MDVGMEYCLPSDLTAVPTLKPSALLSSANLGRKTPLANLF